MPVLYLMHFYADTEPNIRLTYSEHEGDEKCIQ